jgi:putative membrane protein
MHYLSTGWSFDPSVIVAAVVVATHEVGLAQLRSRSTPAHSARRRHRSVVTYAGLAVGVLSATSPLDYWAGRYFFVHMIEHVLLMFIAPALVVLGAPWVPLLHAWPVSWRRRFGRWLVLSSSTAGLRATWRVVSNPWTALIVLNSVMVLWHLPGPFDLAERTSILHVWGMQLSFVLAGLLFWLQILPSRPFHRRATTYWQIGAIIGTNVVMFILAMSMSVLTQHSWYEAYAHIRGVSLSPFADQQIGAAVLWVCGDFWAVPALGFVVRRGIDEEGGVSQLADELLGRRVRRDADAVL